MAMKSLDLEPAQPDGDVSINYHYPSLRPPSVVRPICRGSDLTPGSYPMADPYFGLVIPRYPMVI